MRIDKFIFFCLGLFFGLTATIGGGLILFKIMRDMKEPTRYNAEVPIASQGPSTSAAANDAPKYFGLFQAKNDDWTKQEGSRLYAASSLDKIFRDGKTLVKPLFANDVFIAMAKNEYESFQIVIANGKKPLTGVTLEFSDLINAKTKTRVDKGNIFWHVEGYVPTKKPYYPVKFSGLWPDPLLPGQKTDIDAATTQPFWVTVYMPKEAPAGTYDGMIFVRGDGVDPRQVPLKVHVYNFVISKENHLTTAFDFYGHIMRFRYPQGERESVSGYNARLGELSDKYIVEMLKYRMNPVLNIDPNSQNDLRLIDVYRWFGLTRFSLGKKGGTFNNNWPETDEGIEALLPLYRSYAELLTLNKMFDMHYIYTWDEGEIGNPRVAKVAAMIHKAHPKFKNMVCYHGFWDPDVDPNWGKDIDIWTFQIDDFNEEKMKKLQKLGMEMWMYISGPGSTGAPNLAIDFDGMDPRIVPWMCWKYKLTGFLYWCVNWWTKADPFETAVNTDWEQNGNGLLFYPGPKGPLPSIRTEIYRDGMEDYEYLFILNDMVKSMELKGLETQFANQYSEAKELLTIEPTIIASLQEFTKDATLLLQKRHKIAQAIEAITKILTPKPTTNDKIKK